MADMSDFDAPGQTPEKQMSNDDFMRQFDAVAPEESKKTPSAATAAPMVPPPEKDTGIPLDKKAGVEAAAAATAGYYGLSGLTRALNAALGNWDPKKMAQMQTFEQMQKAGIPTRIGDLTGMPDMAAAIGQNPSWRGRENASEFIPFSGASSMLDKQVAGLKPVIGENAGNTLQAVKDAWGAREGAVDKLWKNLDAVQLQSNLSPIVPDETVSGLREFAKKYGPAKLASIPDKYTAAKLLTIAGYPDEAAQVLSHLTPRQIAFRITQASNIPGGTSFNNFRDLQKAIGRTIGDFAGDPGKPSPPEQADMKRIYANMYNDLDKFGAQEQNKPFMDLFDQARQATKETRDFYEDNNFLRNVVKGNYDQQGMKFLKDFTNPMNAQKISPLAPYVPESQVLPFQAPLVADRATDRLVAEALKEPSSKFPNPSKFLPLLGESALVAGPSIYGSFNPEAAASPLALAAGLGAAGAGTVGARLMNSPTGTRLWGANNPIGLSPTSESPVLGALNKLKKVRLRFAP